MIGSIDRSAEPRYNLTICAEDSHLTVIRSSCKVLDVVVNSPNDQAPVFLQKSYSATVSEIAPIGSFVTRVSALDSDVGITGRLTYRLDFRFFSVEMTMLKLKSEKFAMLICFFFF